MEKHLTIRNSTAEFLIFQAQDKSQGVEVVYHDETILRKWCPICIDPIQDQCQKQFVPRGQLECVWKGFSVNVARKCTDSLNYVAAWTAGCLLKPIPRQRGKSAASMMEIPFLICRPATTLAKENAKQPGFCIEPQLRITGKNMCFR